MRKQLFTPSLLGLALSAVFLGGIGFAPLAHALSFARPDDKSEKDTLAEANAALTANDAQKAANLISQYLSTHPGGSLELEETCAKALLQLKRNDEAAHHCGVALRLAGDDESRRNSIIAKLKEADPLYKSRADLMVQIAENLFKQSQLLYESGHTERALAMLEPLEPIAVGEAKAKILRLAAEIRGKTQKVSLDEGADKAAESGVRPTVRIEGKHYIIKADLERAKAQRVSDVMDSIFTSYVQIYFEGDVTRVAQIKPTIRIHASHAEMMKGNEEMMKGPDGKPKAGRLGGWWSEIDATVYCYDTRPETGSLDQMLMTLFHEASHQFMWMLARGGKAPAWINEGTGTFFEGATAMEDGSVAWPDAAMERLFHLQEQLTKGGGPTAKEVISYDEPGSYPVAYYYYGWGLVYYLQQYEDPTTLQHVFRPLYAKYRDAIFIPGNDQMKLFEQIFLSAGAPGGYSDLDHWIANWRDWILNEVYPLHFGAGVRDKRLAKAKGYIESADRVKAQKATGDVTETQLLERALAELEFVRTLDGRPKLDADLIVLEANLLDRMGRSPSTASLLEQVLKAVDFEGATLEQSRYDEFEKRLTKLDAKNTALRLARKQQRSYAARAADLIEKYQARPVPMTLTTYEFSRALSKALESKSLEQTADALRIKVREAGLFPRILYRIGGPAGAWIPIFNRTNESFDPGETSIGITGKALVGRLFTGAAATGEYELRCTLVRSGEISPATCQGVVFSGNATVPWYTAGIDGNGDLLLRRHEVPGSERTLKIAKLDPPLAKDEQPAFAVHVFEDNRVIIKVGERAPIEVLLEEPLPRNAYIGIFAKAGRTELNSTILELFP